MSAAIVCDHCGVVLEVNSRGDDEAGESGAWLRVGTRDGAIYADACSRSCAVELLGDNTDLTRFVEARLEGIAEVVRTIREDRDREGGDDDGS